MSARGIHRERDKEVPKHVLLCRAQELNEGRFGRPGPPVPNSPYGLCGRKATLNLNLNLITEFRSCVKVEVDVQGPLSLTVLCERKEKLERVILYS